MKELTDRNNNLPTARRTGTRSSRRRNHVKLVAFDLPAQSPSSTAAEVTVSAKRRYRRQRRSLSPSKVLATKDENARPLSAFIDIHKAGFPSLSLDSKSEISAELRSLSKRKQDLERQVIEMQQQIGVLQDALTERDGIITHLIDLSKFLSIEVKIYTSTLEEQVRQQQIVIQELQGK
jgi:hypothetical protein